MKFTKKQKAILIGTILGDGFLQKTGAFNARLRLEHGADQKEYLFWKVHHFSRLFNGTPSYLERVHPKTGRVYKYWRYQSNATPELGALRYQFYPEGKKRIPEILPELLKESLALAVWYMDDGYYYQRDKVSYLYLGKVGKREAEIAQKSIKSNFDINSSILDKKYKGFALYFSRSNAEKLHDAVRPFVLPYFSYKLYSQSP